MYIRLKVVDGPRAGDEFLIKDDIIIGRKQGDLQLRDSKVSNPHAKITRNSSGGYEVEDLGSSNGVVLNGLKIKKAELKIGDELRMGTTRMQIEAEQVRGADTSFEKGSWQSQVNLNLAAALTFAEKYEAAKGQSAKAFFKPIQLEFIQGIQTGQKYVFGFGPRIVGRLSADLPLWEDGLPDDAFELMGDGAGQSVINPLTQGKCI